MRRPAVALTLLLLSTATGASTPAPDRLDAVAAAPASHRILFENDRVRVLRVTIPSGKTEPVHTHAWPSVMRIEVPQPITYITYAMRNGKPVETGRFDAEIPAPVEAEWAEPEGPHAVMNRGSAEFRAVRFELKPGSAHLPPARPAR